MAAITQIAVRRWQPPAAAWAALLLAAGVIASACLWPGPALSQHECLVAQTAKEMLERDDWVVPHFSGLPRLQKTPLAYWCVAALGSVVGTINEAVVRLPSAISGLGLVLLMAWFGRRAFDSAALGWFAAFVTALSAAWLFYSHSGTVEMQLTFWCTLAGMLFWLAANCQGRARRIALLTGVGAAMGVAMLAKGPMPLPVLLPGFLIYLLATGRARRIGPMLLESIPGLTIFLLICLPWPLMVVDRLEGEAVFAKWYREFFLRYEGLVGSGERPRPWWYYVPVLAGLLLPWTASVPEALAGPWLRRYRPWRDVLVLAFCLAAFNLVFFSTAGYKRPHYLLPAIPWFCILLTPAVWRFFVGPIYAGPRLSRVLGVAIVVAVVLGLAGSVVFALAEKPPYARAAAAPVAVLAGGLMVFGLALALRARTWAMWILAGAITVTFCLSWAKLGRFIYDTKRETAFAKAVADIVPAGMDIYSLGRPEARLVYYGKLRMRRVITDLELERRIRELNMPRTPKSAIRIGVKSLIELLARPEPVYVVAQYGHWEQLQAVRQFVELRPELLYHQTGYKSDSKDDLILMANQAGKSAAKRAPAEPSESAASPPASKEARP